MFNYSLLSSVYYSSSQTDGPALSHSLLLHPQGRLVRVTEDIRAGLVPDVSHDMRESVAAEPSRKLAVHDLKRPHLRFVGVLGQGLDVEMLVMVCQLQDELVAVEPVGHLVDDFQIVLLQSIVGRHVSLRGYSRSHPSVIPANSSYTRSSRFRASHPSSVSGKTSGNVPRM